jgi:ATP-binding cassette subfamily F protein uup
MEKLLLNVQEAMISFSGKPLFENMSFNIAEGDKICLVGKNGAGKTTLMNVITGAKELDAGERWMLQGTTVGYLQQEVHPKAGQTVFEYVFEQLSSEERESQKYKVEQVLEPLEIDPAAYMEKLSGGQLRRAALARALVEDPDILLMDEPTNHLDLAIIEWLETFLRSWRGALIVISHDKTFLSNISDKVFWLDRGKLRVCPRGFSGFEEWMIMQLEIEEKELRSRQKALEIEVEWASRGVKARRKRNVRRLEKMKEEREKLRRDRNAYNRMMAKIELPPAEQREMSSKIVSEFIKADKSFNEDGKIIPILENFNFRILRGDRIGLLGRNGSGKTTFLRMLIQELDPDGGKVKLAREIEYSYFDQKRRDLDPTMSLWGTLCPDGGEYVNVRGKARHVAGYLRDFMFDPSKIHQRVSTLSGGQKNRLMLAKILADPKSLLIMDEPTNDLDMETLDMLEEILADYEGTLLIVSHDRDFLDQTVSKILAFEGNGVIKGYIGGYSDYLQDREQELRLLSEPSSAPAKKGPQKNAPAAAAGEKKEPARKLSYKLRYELEKLPETMEALQKEIGEIEDTLSDPGLYKADPGQFTAFTRRLVDAREELEHAETRWLELEQMQQAAEG